jgi:predicted nucleic acid-binding protein
MEQVASRRKAIIFDTNVLYGDFRLEGKSLNRLAELCVIAEATLFIPEVVIQEFSAQYKEKVCRTYKNLEQNVKDWSRLAETGISTDFAKTNLDQTTQSCESSLRDRLSCHGIKTASLPDVGHEILVRRAVDKKKPFKSKGPGYRDTLIWFTILKLIENGIYEVIFVTNNKDDFGEGPRPHPDLLKDLEEKGIEKDRVTILPSIEQVLEDHIFPKLKLDSKFAEKIEQDDLRNFSLRRWFESGFPETITEHEWHHTLMGLEQGHGTVRIRGTKLLEDPQMLRVLDLPNDNCLVDMTCKFSVDTCVLADNTDLCSYDDLARLLGVGLNEDSVSVEFIPFRAKFRVRLEIDTKEEQLVSSEITDCESPYWQ